MGETLKNCWEIKNCGRQKGGAKVVELGICVAAREKLGHSCWTIAGTLCGGKVKGTFAEKEKNCMLCDVYKLYNRLCGSKGKEVAENFPEEENIYKALLMDRFNHQQLRNCSMDENTPAAGKVNKPKNVKQTVRDMV